MEAAYYIRLPNDVVQCQLCPHECIVQVGRRGICKVRKNISGVLFAEGYGVVSSVQFDPVEKKPLYHFYPGKEILSLGSLGCNLSCKCCQNYEIAQNGVEGFSRVINENIQSILRLAESNVKNVGIAYTYNEPIVWYEYVKEMATMVKESGLKNVMVSNGYIMPKPLTGLLPFIDAFNIDLKSFNPASHYEFTGGELPYVKYTLKTIAASTCHLEVTHLVVSGFNDTLEQFKEIPVWIADNLGPTVPLHLSRYFPRYKYDRPATGISIMKELAEYARQYLKYVYLGNIPGHAYQSTVCPECGTIVIGREGCQNQVLLTQLGSCNECGCHIAVC